MNSPDLTTKSLFLACAIALAAPACKGKPEIIQPKDHKVAPIAREVKVEVRESLFPELEEPTKPEEPEQTAKEPPLPEHPEETRSVEFPSGETLPLVEWGEPDNYEGCENLSFQNDSADIQKDCYFYNPLKKYSPLVRVEGNERVFLSDHFQAWELAIIDPADIAAGNIDPNYYYEHEVPDSLSEEGKRTVYLYKVARIDPSFVELIEEVRRAYGFPIAPDEAYRSYVHNHNTGAAKRSTHLSGAMDINMERTLAFLRAKCETVPNTTCALSTSAEVRDHIAKLAERAMKRGPGGGGIGKGTTILHLDNHPKKQGDHIRRWVYPK
jgi:hypothetical protein